METLTGYGGYQVRVAVVRESAKATTVASPAAVAEFVRVIVADEPQERFLCVGLDAQNKVVAWWEVTRGVLAASLVHPREVFANAVAMRCAAVVVAHNHPSGDPTPSREDDRITERLRKAGALLGIEVLDHVVVGTSCSSAAYWSYRERGLLGVACATDETDVLTG